MTETTNTYLVIGQRRQNGAIGIPDDFQIEKDALSSREAYITVRDESYNGGYETVLVTAIKMKSPFSQKFTIEVPSEYYLEGV
jgi:hypothetical protein